MDPSFLIGIVAGFGAVFYGVVQNAGGIEGFQFFYNLPSILIVVGGTFAAIVASFPLRVLKGIPKHILICIKGKLPDPMVYIDEIVECAQIARKNGLLALEEHANAQEDPFLRDSLLLIVDAVDADKVRNLLENDLANLEARHNEAVSIYDRGAAYAPAFGMIGTLIGLIVMLNNLKLDSGGTGELTSGMAVALITTFYGSVLANLVFTPIASKLQVRHEKENLCKEIVIEGILSIQSGENPKFIREKLLSFLSGQIRAKEAEAGAGEGGAEGEGGGKKPKKEKAKKKGKEK